MKIIHKLKYTLLLLFGMFQMVSVKAAFNEDFSSSSLKLPAMFVSKAAIDYKYFNTNNRLNALNNVVVSPTKKIDDSDSWWKWKLNVNQDDSVLLNTSIEGVVKANDDHFTFEYSTFNIASNDTFDGKTEALILTGAHQNATISPLGVWPLGIKLDATKGEITIAPGTSLPKEPLMYNLCVFNSSTCSTANITFDNQSVSIDKNDMFSLSSEISTICYSGNAQSRVVKYTLKNISGRAIKISGESKGSGVNNKKIRFVGGNINVNSLRVISGDMRFTGALGYVGPKTFAIDEEVVFELSFKRSTDAEISGELEMRYGNSSASGQMVNPDFRLNVSNKISRIPDKQENFTKVLNPKGSYTVYQASGLTDAIVNYKFYDPSGNEVAANSPINMNFTGILNYSYSKVSASGCEGERGYISFSKTNIELPDPGKISLSEGSLLESKDVCFDDNDKEFKIYNNENGKGTRVTPGGVRYALKYSWESSYDEGLTWYPYEDNGNANTETDSGSKSMTLKGVQKSFWLRRKAHERPTGTRPNNFAYSNVVKINVQKNEVTIAGGTQFSRPLFAVNSPESTNNHFLIPSITTKYPSTIEVFDMNGVKIENNRFDFTKEGTYVFTVVATSTGANGTVKDCVSYATITLNVYDLAKCRVVTERVVATAAPSGSGWGTTLAGVVTNKELAYDNDLSTYSTISSVVALLGLGTTWQNIYFDHVVPAGTPLKVKLGQEYSGLQLGGGITVVGLDEKGNSIGPIKSVGEGALLDLLVGDNVFEYTFVPTNARGKAVAYKGVRVIVGSLLAVANNAVLYGAYYEKDRVLAENETVPEETIYAKGAKLPASNTQPNKLKYIVPNSPEDIVVLTPQNETTGIKLNNYVNDVTWGVEDAGLGVATSLSSVVYPYLAVDEDPFTYAIFNKTVAALNRQKLTVNLRNTARPGDELELIMTSEGVNILSLDLGASFKVQRYMDDIPVGPVVASNQFKVINLNLFLFKNPIPRFRITGIDQPFNRVEITYFSLVQANLGNYTYLHDISIVPQSVFGNTIDVNKTLEICAADLIKIKKPSVCTDFKLNFVLGEIVEQEVFDYDENGQLVSKIVKSYKELEGESNQLKDNVVTRVHEDANTAYYEIKKLYEINNPNQILLVKVQAVQNGQDYGAPQYIRVELKNCLDSMVNPVINLDTKDLINIKDFSASN